VFLTHPSQKIFIYGGSGGIGSATGRLLHARGYELHLVGRDEKRLGAIARDIHDGNISPWKAALIFKTSG
jgi:short-subunit dehydrogenase